MKTYRVMIEETVCDVFTVEAETPEEAKEKISKGYRKGEYVLEPGNVAYTQMHIVDEDNCTIADDNWEEI